jgi:Glucose / Sorbosone dehydrogenase
MSAAPAAGAELRLVRVADGLNQPLHVTSARGEHGRMYVVEKVGVVKVVEGAAVRAAPFLDLSDRVSTRGERGLLSLAFDPMYTSNRFLYVLFTDRRGATRVVRFRANSARSGVSTRTARVLLKVARPAAATDGGHLAFGKDGLLYVGLGDGGSNPGKRPQALRSMHGKLVRLNVRNLGRAPVKVGLGLQNPRHFSFDRATGDLYLPDVGRSRAQEVNFVTRRTLAASAGDRRRNFGWPRFDGNRVHSRGTALHRPSVLVRPVHVYRRSAGCSVTGGFVYRGPVVEARGRYFFGDRCTGAVWSFRTVSGHKRDFRREQFALGGLSSFGEDSAGNLYLASRLRGTLYRLGSATTPGNTGLRNGLLGTDLSYFPIAVWMQQPEYWGGDYKALGINVFHGLWDPPGTTNTRVQALEKHDLTAIVHGDQMAQALATTHPQRVVAWHQIDEPDNAQWTGSGWGPCIDPRVVIDKYNQWKAANPTRPIVINFGFGAAYTSWVGRGSCTGKTEMYPEYQKGADIVSFDIYPVNEGWPITYVADGVDNLIRWTNGEKPVWAFVETTRYQETNGTPSPAQTRAQVWLALTHGASAIQYFVHIFTPTFIEAGVLQDAAMKAELTRTNGQIKSLARVLNSPTVTNGASVSASGRIDHIVKRLNGETYLFAVNPTASTLDAQVSVSGLSSGTVTVIDENRSLALANGRFGDRFGAYGVHLYRITP